MPWSYQQQPVEAAPTEFEPGVQIIAVQENQTQMQVPPELRNQSEVHSYLEALGVLVI